MFVWLVVIPIITKTVRSVVIRRVLCNPSSALAPMANGVVIPNKIFWAPNLPALSCLLPNYFLYLIIHVAANQVGPNVIGYLGP